MTPMQSRCRRFRAYLYYLRKPIRNFLPLLSLLLGLLLAGGICFHKLYDHRPLGFVRALYITYCLIFTEHLLDFPNHWLLQLFYIVLPPLGLLVILDGVVRFSYHILRWDENSEEWTRAMAKTLNNHVILCGLGKVGLRILQQLVRLGEDVAVLEKEPNCPNIAYARKQGVPVRVGHSREEGIFDDLNLSNAKSIILATNDDLANLELALDARKANPRIRVIMRLFDQELAAKIRDSFGDFLAFSTSDVSAPLFATSSSDRSIVNSFYVGDELLVVAKLKVRADSELAGKQIRALGKGRHVFVISHCTAGAETVFPSADAVFQAGDELTIQARPDVLKEIHRMNHDPQPY